MRVRVRAAKWPGVFIGDEDEAGFLRGFEDGVECGGIFCRLAGFIEFSVAVVDGNFVPDADVDGVALGEIGDAVFIERNPWMGIVHDGDGLFGGVSEAAGGKVVSEAESLAWLMRGLPAGALENHRE